MPWDEQDEISRDFGWGKLGTSLQSRPPSRGGPVVPANIQLYNRPRVPVGGLDMSAWNRSIQGPQGNYGTVYSESQPDESGQEVLYPRIYGGHLHSSDEAWQHYKQTGEHMGKFLTPEDADQFGEQYHIDASQGMYDQPRKFAHASVKK